MDVQSTFKRLIFVISTFFLTACSSALPPDSPDIEFSSPLISRVTSPRIEINKSDIPQVDRTKAVVPAEEIYFDTFRSYDRVVPLSKADESLILRLRDAIPPIYNPSFVTHDNAGFLSGQDLILGYAQDDIAVAYPIKILNWHEIVSHEVDGIPILATY